jgi:hypothetical protein
MRHQVIWCVSQVAKAQEGNPCFGIPISAVVALSAVLGAIMNPAIAVGVFAAGTWVRSVVDSR